MTRLFAMAAEMRASGVEPRVVELSADDERCLFESAEDTFGRGGAEAARQSRDHWRAFLVQWFDHTVKLALTLDTVETRVG